MKRLKATLIIATSVQLCGWFVLLNTESHFRQDDPQRFFGHDINGGIAMGIGLVGLGVLFLSAIIILGTLATSASRKISEYLSGRATSQRGFGVIQKSEGTDD